MGLVDALSRKDEIDTNDDNQEIALLKGGDQYFHICTLDTILADKLNGGCSYKNMTSDGGWNEESIWDLPTLSLGRMRLKQAMITRKSPS